jgi:hypothetical protein
MFTFDIHPSGMEFKAKVTAHAANAHHPFSTLSIDVDELKVTLFAKADDALKLIRAAKLLNEVFASEKVEAGE